MFNNEHGKQENDGITENHLELLKSVRANGLSSFGKHLANHYDLLKGTCLSQDQDL